MNWQCVLSQTFIRKTLINLFSFQWDVFFYILLANQDCGEPPFLTNGDTTETSRSHYKRNERVHYSCKAYHTMEGGPYRTCINGKWSGEMKCLSKSFTIQDIFQTYWM